ncbi:hypothetical protein OG21DRAFT_1606902 [Imleria badia]|nr:hypothetical protein OG21DRAFT_1606902 [Imleria badia]
MSVQDVSLTLVTTPRRGREREREGERGHEMTGRGRHRQKEGEGGERAREGDGASCSPSSRLYEVDKRRVVDTQRERASERGQRCIVFVALVVDRQRERGGRRRWRVMLVAVVSERARARRRHEGGRDDKGKGDGFVVLASCPGHRVLALSSHVDRERGRARARGAGCNPVIARWERWRQRRRRRWRVELVAKWQGQGNRDGSNNGSGNGGRANAVAAQWPSSVVDERAPECTGCALERVAGRQRTKAKGGTAAVDESELLGAGDGVEDGWLSDSGASEYGQAYPGRTDPTVK